MKIVNGLLKLIGEQRKVGTPVVNILETNASNLVTIASGATLPTAGDAGYAVGCVFTHSSGLEYINTGSVSACAFHPRYPTVAASGTTVAKTADYPVVAGDLGKIFTNAAAGGTVVLTLPAVAASAGKALKVTCLAAQIIRLLPVTGEAIYLNGSGVVTKYLNIAGVIGNYVDIVSNGTYWEVAGYSGVVTKEA